MSPAAEHTWVWMPLGRAVRHNAGSSSSVLLWGLKLKFSGA